MSMEAREYTVVKIEGEYAYLREAGASSADDVFIALALLPLGTDEGSRLLWENFTYTLL